MNNQTDTEQKWQQADEAADWHFVPLLHSPIWTLRHLPSQNRQAADKENELIVLPSKVLILTDGTLLALPLFMFFVDFIIEKADMIIVNNATAANLI